MFKVRRFMSFISLFSAVGLFFMLNKTNPMQVGPHGVIGFFILLYLFFLGVIWWGLLFFLRVLVCVGKVIMPIKPLRVISDKAIFYLSSGLSFSPVILITLRSISAVQFYDYLLVFIFSSLVFIYVLKSKI